MDVAMMQYGLLVGVFLALVGFVLVYFVRKSPYNIIGLFLTLAGLGLTAMNVYNTYVKGSAPTEVAKA